MKCVQCGFEAPVADFYYLYNARIDASMSMRECPKCHEWNSVDELTGEPGQIVQPGDAPWGKSAGIEGVEQKA